MICVELGASNELVANPNTVENCNTYLLMEKADYNLLVQPLNIQSGDIAYVFAWGFASVLTFWVLGYAVGAAKTAINKL